MARPLICVAGCLLLAACASTGSGVPAAAVAPDAMPDASALIGIERRAGLAYGEGRNAEAATLYLELTRAVPAEPLYWYRLGNALVRTARYDDAAIAYQRAVAREPENARAWHNLGIVRMRQAQESFAKGVEHSAKGDTVFDDSLRLSTSLYSLASHGTADAGAELQVQPAVGPGQQTPAPAP